MRRMGTIRSRRAEIPAGPSRVLSILAATVAGVAFVAGCGSASTAATAPTTATTSPLASVVQQFQQAAQPFDAAARTVSAAGSNVTSSQVEQVEEAAGETAHLLAAIQWPPAAAADAGHLEQVGEAIQTAGIDYAGLPADLAAWSSAYTKLAGDLGGVQP